jgi:ABC-type multidrug transport system ATPase subunit
MPEGQVLEFAGVTKRFGAVAAVSDLTARIEPGRVTGFLGPNGAGKTTSLRILLGLVRATEGTATIGGVPYAKLDRPLQTVGAVLEASSFHPGRTAAGHLRVYAAAAGIPRARVDEVLGLVGLADAANRKVGGFSLGMRQRLGLAYALLGDPGVLVLDEPANGLDPEGIKWMRGFLRELAREGRTVLVSSHLLTEVQQTVDSLLVIAQGRIVFEGSLDELADPSEYATVVDSQDRAALAAAFDAAGVEYEILRSGLTVRTLDPVRVGQVAASAGVALSSLQRKGPALEEVFLELVRGERVYARAQSGEPAPSELPGYGVAVAPLAMAPAEGEDAAVETEGAVTDEAVDAVAPGAAEADAVDAEAAPEAEPPATAGFAVASTGVIDIIVEAEAAAEADAENETAAEHEPGPEPEAAAEADAEKEPADGDDTPDAEPEAEEEVEPESEPESDSVTDPEVESAPSDAERPFDEYPKTEADMEADAFFAAFDDDAGSDTEGAASTDEDDAPEQGGDR